jgi:GNAT superfamily N-acetyltransferase
MLASPSTEIRGRGSPLVDDGGHNGVTVREWTAEDVAGLVALAERAGVEGSEHVLQGQLQHQQLSRLEPEHHFFCRLLAEVDGRIVGTAFAQDQIFVPRDWLSGRVHVDREHRMRGIGSALASALDARLEQRRCAGLVGRIRAEDGDSRAWAERRGFTLAFDEVTCVVDPPAVPDEVVRASRPDVDRLTFFSLAEHGRSADLPRLYELVATLLGETPEIDGAPGPSPRAVECAFTHSLHLSPEATWVAACGDEWIGVTVSGGYGDGGLYTWLTGVRATWRGRGVARALKARAVSSARSRGIRRMVSEVAVTNAAMLALNRSLGARLQQPVSLMRRPRRQSDETKARR